MPSYYSSAHDARGHPPVACVCVAMYAFPRARAEGVDAWTLGPAQADREAVLVLVRHIALRVEDEALACAAPRAVAALS